ncbi:thioredoxin [Candidatus Berkelbacteria bacterium RIFCSPLOWO2_01_FULL_50_28]|uniref:Thioredoxin n=1 Tax=Candidatus Berkelbacteria bacterium RIFCSPLOWO2_01_FULL_50_28 TaxID=1797471 RepID=A0A1F5EC27_9BACT|nr:MAG: thioredoxin [Candidatus Berkelbacteria bacterium RIFCSPHIGHO2_01_FULL_50_36]OGD63239.1 MAG: thioredoxin [Candidatus Berkelbacteria bacterium RIFCSPHIGHO2_12_FULL_50_11]OGD64826.1 MAG: thioredoxin [Candidatus Berkelbacteria bacterium RIFCSPLOWO2_01_FULL_50_28]
MKENVTLLDFWAAWCGPCKIMHPVIEELEHEFAGKVRVVKVNVDEPTSQKMVEQYQVGAMPTYIVEKDGNVVVQYVGTQSKRTLVEALNKALD